jgi:acyl-CoA synthetase (AMP-forming)/AMP-acid ligase II
MKNKKKPVYLPLTHALAWIVGSTLLISGSSHLLLKHYFKKRERIPQHAIQSIIQTGPQKEALKTQYLAELLAISRDRPYSNLTVDLSRVKQRLLQSPLISKAEVKWIKPDALYIDYTVRQPIAWVEDYANLVIDKDGYLFPFSPFFSPKRLPSIYFGLSAFGMPSPDPERPSAQWGIPLQGKYADLAFEILAIVTDPFVADLFSVKRIDVSNAFAESYGTREIVIITEELCVLRLSTKNYRQDLGNYLKLRDQLLQKEKNSGSDRREKVIDFRIQKLAFIDESL